ncbi:MAG: SGNH/GDSL hydrolase family protein [Anaerolineae bacterium]
MKTILCYGDSNTYGTAPMTSFSTAARFGYDERWTGVLRGELGADYHIIEEGLPGRTTVRDDPVEGAHKNGRTYLLACLESHQPLDLVVLMLGTNDLKKRFSTNAFEVAAGAEALVNIMRTSMAGLNGGAPKILLLCPPPLARLDLFAGMFEGGDVTSRGLAGYFERVASNTGCGFLDVGKVLVSSEVDGIHFDLSEHTKLGKAVAAKVRTMI